MTADAGGGVVQVVGRSVRGASHVRAKLPNQDAYACLPESGRGENVVVAVADGHGSSRSFRSDRGAKLAVTITTRLLRSGTDTLVRTPMDRTGGQLQALAKRVVERWVREVRADLERHPFHEDELDGLDEHARLQLADNPLLAYGTTVLATAVTRTGVYYLQLGDGDIVLVARDGTAWLPLPPDRRLAGNETTSLCLPDAWRDFRVGADALAQAPRLVLLSTDGYANSFQSEAAFLQVGNDLLPMIEQRGLEAVGRSLEEWLHETTERGAGDDVTLAVVSLPLPAGYGRATAPRPAVPPVVTPPAPTVRQEVPAIGDPWWPREDVGVPGRRPVPAEPVTSGYRRGEPAAPSRPAPRRQDTERRGGELLVAAGLIGAALLLAALLLWPRSGEPPPPATNPPTTVASTLPERRADAVAVGDSYYVLDTAGRLWVGDQRRDLRSWRLLADYGGGWDRLQLRDGGLWLVADQGQRLVERLPAPTTTGAGQPEGGISPDQPSTTGSGGSGAQG